MATDLFIFRGTVGFWLVCRQFTPVWLLPALDTGALCTFVLYGRRGWPRRIVCTFGAEKAKQGRAVRHE